MKADTTPPPATKTSMYSFARTKWRDLSFARILHGGRLTDGGRAGRYIIIVVSGLAIAWLPAAAYLKFAKPSYTSHFSVILPGAGSSSSVNVSDIGQASSTSASAYSSPSISPTVTYKNLLMSANVVEAAAKLLNVPAESLPEPTIKLVDETSFIVVEMPGDTPAQARNRSNAILDGFFAELSKLRDDEGKRRESSTISTVKDYETAVNDVRRKISDLQISSGLSSVEQFAGYVATADGLKTRIADTTAQLAKTKQSEMSLTANLHVSPDLAATTMKLHADPQYAALADATAKAQADYAATAQQYGTNHPKVIDAHNKFVGVQSQMMARATKITGLSGKKLIGKIDLAPSGQRPALMSQLVAMETEKQGLDGQLASMTADLTSTRQQIASLVDVAANLDRLNRDYKVAEAVFASALARINTSKTDIFASYPMVQVTEAAVMPLKPSSPNRKVAFGAAGASTFLLLFAAFLGWMRRPLIDKLLKKNHEEA